MRKRVRLESLNTKRLDVLAKALGSGHYMNTACTLAGIPARTVYDWLKEAEQCEGKETLSHRERVLTRLSQTLKKAEASAIDRSLQVISDAMPTNWQAAAWYLERRRPQEFGRRVVEHTGEVTVKGYANVSPDAWPDAGTVEEKPKPKMIRPPDVSQN